MGDDKGVPSILGVFGLAPPCTITGDLNGVGSEFGAGISLAISACILTDFGVTTPLGVSLVGVSKIGFLHFSLVRFFLSHLVV